MEKTGRGLTTALIILFCLLAGAFCFLRSPYFDITLVEIEGIYQTAEDEVRSRLGQASKNIFAFDLDKSARLIELAPWVKEAKVSRRLPGTIRVQVTERIPVAFCPGENGMWLVDEEGRVLSEDDGTWTALVALTGPLGHFEPGQFLSSDGFGQGLEVLANLGEHTRGALTEICVQENEVALILDDGCKVLMGAVDRGANARSHLLESILLELKEEGRVAVHIDLRFDKPAVKERFVGNQGE